MPLKAMAYHKKEPGYMPGSFHFLNTAPSSPSFIPSTGEIILRRPSRTWLPAAAVNVTLFCRRESLSHIYGIARAIKMV
jgi:hypothetical protein